MTDLLRTIEDLSNAARQASHAVRGAEGIEDDRVTGSVAYTLDREIVADQILYDALRNLRGAMDRMTEKLKS